MTDLEKLTSADFMPIKDETLYIEYQDGELEVKLVTVEDLKHPNIAGKRQGFSLILQSSLKDQYLPQGMYYIKHPAGKMERIAVFIVPLQPNQQGVPYQIIFN